MADKITWDDAINSGNFVKLEVGEPKQITITNWELVEVEKEFNNKKETKVELQADVVMEDGEEVEKRFTTTSNRLKKGLRPILENREPTEEVKLNIVMVGESFQTQYSVKEAK